MQGILKIDDFSNDYSVFEYGGGTVGYTAMMFRLDKTNIVIDLLPNVVTVHVGLEPSTVGVFSREVLLPAVIQYL